MAGISITCAVIIAAIGIKFFNLSVIRGKELSEIAGKQRIVGTQIESERGMIYDRNLIPLTNRSDQILVCLIPEKLSDRQDVVKDISGLCGEDFTKVMASLKSSSLPIFFKITEEQKKYLDNKYDGLIPFIYTAARYDDNSIAKHITGYINETDQKGVTGIENKFNDELSSSMKKRIISVVDAVNKPIKGFGYTISDGDEDVKEPLNVKLTIDYNIQKICEQVISDYGVDGSFVVQDTKTGDILAMGSYPDYSHGHISDYLDSSRGELVNGATAAYNLGSVFKIVVAAKALELGIGTDYSFYCPGYFDVDGRMIKCHTYNSGGHGIVDMKTAFADSCNTYFIDLGIEIGLDNILDMAERLGFGSETGIDGQGINENSGILPRNEYYTNGDIANLSIGQGQLLATPVQIANMITTIANDGVRLTPNIVEGLCNTKGEIEVQIKKEEKNRILKISDAQMIKEFMNEVVKTGTAKSLSSMGLGEACGKTGSAETGVYDSDGRQIVHSWFAGFYPLNEPRYTVVVFLKNGAGLSKSAVNVFGEMVSKF